MSTELPFNYGCRPQCRQCEHRDADLADKGHPNPCSMVRWEGHRHKLPDWQDGECGDFKQLPEVAACEESNIKDLLRAIWEHGLECSESDEMDDCDEIAMVIGCFDELRAERDSLVEEIAALKAVAGEQEDQL